MIIKGYSIILSFCHSVIVLIEDEMAAQRQLKRLISNVVQNHEILATLESIEEAVEWFDGHSPPDLAFFDIQLSDGLSFDIFKKQLFNTPLFLQRLLIITPYKPLKSIALTTY